MNKIKSKGLTFKSHPTCIVLKSNQKVNYQEMINLIGQNEYHSVSSFPNTILEQEPSVRLETNAQSKDENSDFLTAYEIIYCDLESKKKAEL